MEDQLLEKKVNEVMRREVFLVNLDHTWSDVARKMSAKAIHHVVVVDEAHKPLTVVSSFDFLTFAHKGEPDRGAATLRDTLKTRRLISIGQDDRVLEAISEMNTHHLQSVVVLDESGRVVGILTPRDIMNLLLEFAG